MKRRILGIVLAVALAAVGTGVLMLYVSGAEQRALAGVEVADVLLVQERIQKGTAVEDLGDRVRVEKVATKMLADGAVSDVGELEGKVAMVDLLPGEQVVEDRFAEPAAFQAAGRVQIPDGLQVVSVSLSPDRAVGGQVSPGDTVGVVASFADGEATTHLILHRVLVTNVQGGSASRPDAEADGNADRDAEPSGNMLVSFAVKASDAEKVVFAAEHGTIWLTSQSDDASTSGTSVKSLKGIFQ